MELIYFLSGSIPLKGFRIYCDFLVISLDEQTKSKDRLTQIAYLVKMKEKLFWK